MAAGWRADARQNSAWPSSGAVTTEAAETVRKIASTQGMIAIGSCTVTGGIPGMLRAIGGHVEAVYGDAAPDACGDLLHSISDRRG